MPETKHHFSIITKAIGNNNISCHKAKTSGLVVLKQNIAISINWNIFPSAQSAYCIAAAILSINIPCYSQKIPFRPSHHKIAIAS